MPVSGIGELFSPTNGPVDNLSNVFENDLGKEEFLKLLVAQLQNQDPLNPMEGQEFASQLAQFSSVEQLSSIDRNISDGIRTDLILSQSINNTLATTLIGKEVTAVGNKVEMIIGEDTKMNFELGEFAESVTITIYNKDGIEVREIEGNNISSGVQNLSWDGKDADGNELSEGTYTFSVEATGKSGVEIRVQPLIKGLAGSLQYRDGGAVLKIGQLSVAFGDVLEISNGFIGGE